MCACVRVGADDARAARSRTYVHCKAGQSRSVLVAIAYLMHSQHQSWRDAYQYVLARRPVACPNLAFIAELMAFERQMHTQMQRQHPPSSSSDWARPGLDPDPDPDPVSGFDSSYGAGSGFVLGPAPPASPYGLSHEQHSYSFGRVSNGPDGLPSLHRDRPVLHVQCHAPHAASPYRSSTTLFSPSTALLSSASATHLSSATTQPSCSPMARRRSLSQSPSRLHHQPDKLPGPTSAPPSASIPARAPAHPTPSRRALPAPSTADAHLDQNQ